MTKSVQIINTSDDGSTIDVILTDDSEITLSPGQSVTDSYVEGSTAYTHVELTGASDSRDAAELDPEPTSSATVADAAFDPTGEEAAEIEPDHNN